MSRDGLPGCSFAIFSAFPFVLDFFASCEKWFATLKKRFLLESLAIKILALLFAFFIDFLNE